MPVLCLGTRHTGAACSIGDREIGIGFEPGCRAGDALTGDAPLRWGSMPNDSPPQRPSLFEVGTGAELTRWYWLKTELIGYAREQGIVSTGSKADLIERIAAHLDGRPLAPAAAGRPSAGSAQLSGPLDADTVIPAGQRASRALRAYFIDAVGPSFRFDDAMRTFIADGAGRTLGEAVDHWNATRDRPRTDIGAQFEFNRFIRDWHRDHPSGTRAGARAAWARYRSLPVDRRGTD
jgi:hypothetical protein